MARFSDHSPDQPFDPSAFNDIPRFNEPRMFDDLPLGFFDDGAWEPRGAGLRTMSGVCTGRVSNEADDLL